MLRKLGTAHTNKGHKKDFVACVAPQVRKTRPCSSAGCCCFRREMCASLSKRLKSRDETSAAVCFQSLKAASACFRGCSPKSKRFRFSWCARLRAQCAEKNKSQSQSSREMFRKSSSDKNQKGKNRIEYLKFG